WSYSSLRAEIILRLFFDSMTQMVFAGLRSVAVRAGMETFGRAGGTVRRPFHRTGPTTQRRNDQTTDYDDEDDDEDDFPTPDTRYSPMTLIGIDTGGTFTDFVFFTEDGRMEVRKAPSTPDDPSRSLVVGLSGARLGGSLALRGVPPGFEVVHGTTVATNALLEGKGAK